MILRRLAVAGVLLFAVASSAPSAAVSRPTQSPGYPLWLALGDSYSAGQGIPGTDAVDRGPDGQEECARANGRGANAWSVVAYNDLFPGVELTVDTFVFKACTGYMTHQIQDEIDEARREELRDRAADVVSLSVGGNDIGFASGILGCLDLPPPLALDFHIGCDFTKAEMDARIDTLVRDTLPRPPASGYEGLKTLPQVLRELVDQNVIRPGGHVIVLGYPQLVEEPSRWPLVNRFYGECQRVLALDASMIRSVAGYLNQQIALAVQRADAASYRGVRFHWFDVSRVYETSNERHGLCTPDQWINGLSLGLLSSPRRIQHEASFHPTQEGHDHTGRALATFLRSEVGAERLNDDRTGVVNAPGTGAVVAVPGGTSSVLVDVSSSMDDFLGAGGTKLEAAIRAATDVLTLMESESGTATGLVTFSDDANVLSPPATDVASLRTLVTNLRTQSQTDIGAGLEASISQLEAAGGGSVILLSDGQVTDGISPDQILTTLLPRAIAADIKIFAIGFGDPGTLDEDLLRRLSNESGGVYGAAGTAFELRRSFVEAKYQAQGTVLSSTTGEIAQGEVVDAATFSVDPNRAELHMALVWPGSDLDPQLIDPAGVTVDVNYPGAQLFPGQNPEVAVIATPAAGDWRLRVTGVDVPGPTEPYFAITSTRGEVAAPPPAPSAPAFVDGGGGTSLLPFVLGGGGALTVAGGAATALLLRRRRRMPVVSAAPASTTGLALYLRVANGFSAGSLLTVQPGDVIGRDEGAAICLPDDTVSRQHAQVMLVDGVFAIVDLGSTAGTVRNGELVTQARLLPGDVVDLGEMRLVVEGSTGA